MSKISRLLLALLLGVMSVAGVISLTFALTEIFQWIHATISKSVFIAIMVGFCCLVTSCLWYSYLRVIGH